MAEHDNQLYCKQCHGRKFGTKGYGFGGGAGALNMDKGGHVGNKDTNTGYALYMRLAGLSSIDWSFRNKPAGGGIVGKTVAPEDGGCPRCGKRVYDAEKAIGCPDGVNALANDRISPA